MIKPIKITYTLSTDELVKIASVVNDTLEDCFCDEEDEEIITGKITDTQKLKLKEIIYDIISDIKWYEWKIPVVFAALSKKNLKKKL